MYCKLFGERLAFLSNIAPNYVITYGCYACILTSLDAILRYDACARVGLMCGGMTVISLCKMMWGFTGIVRDIGHLNRLHVSVVCCHSYLNSLAILSVEHYFAITALSQSFQQS